MPFYVDFSTKRRTIHLRDIVDDQYIFCATAGDLIHLFASLNDYFNHRNETFEWEQIKGNPTVLDDVNAFATFYPFTDTSDKIFRFWINKGTAKEQYLDAYIYHTPSSKITLGFSTAPQKHVSATVRDIQFTPTTKVAGFSRLVIPTVSGISANTVTFTLPTEASILTYALRMEVYFSATATHSPSLLVDTFYPPYSDSYVAVEGFYTFKFYYDIPGNLTVFESNLIVSSIAGGGSFDGIHIVDDVVSQFGYNVNTISVTKFSNKTLGVSPTEFSFEGFNVETREVIRFDNKFITVPELTKITFGYNTPILISLLRAEPSGVGHQA